MPSQEYDEILRRARAELSEEELTQLAAELKRSMPLAQAVPHSGSLGSVYESMQRRGLIGKLTSAPADLSTNPAHMEGFGADA
jgi:hypothetical protein